MSFFFYLGSYEKRGTAKPFLLNMRYIGDNYF